MFSAADNFIKKEVFTDCGDIKIIILKDDGDQEEMTIWTEKDIDTVEEELKKAKTLIS